MFVRVSGYEESDLVGQPHSKIRHPDMPASVFRLFWDMLQAGESIAAYVKNRARDGEYYWVMAMAVPVQDGYLSVRLKPTSDQLPIVKDIYARVLACEEAAASQGESKGAIIDAGTVALTRELKGLGFETYVDFMQRALVTEMMCRAETLAQNTLPPSRTPRQHFSGNDQSRVVSDLYIESSQCDRALASMLGELTALESANRNFASACKEICEQAEIIRGVAMNSHICATNGVLDAISGQLAAAEADLRQLLELIDDAFQRVSDSLKTLEFNVSVASLQSEIATIFLKELEVGSSPATEENVVTLLTQSCSRQIELFEHLDCAGDWFRDIASLTDKLKCNAKTLRYIRMAGVTEATYLPSDHAFIGLFEQVKESIAASMSFCTTLDHQVQDCESVISGLASTKKNLANRVSKIQMHTDEVGSAYCA